MKRVREIMPGTVVRVSYPEGGQFKNAGMKFDGQEFTVRRKKDIKLKNGVVIGTYYELYGANGLLGVPFGFLIDELEVVKEK